MIDYAPILGTQGADNEGGFATILAMPKRWLANIPAVVGGGAPGDLNTIAAAITVNNPLAEGFVKMYATDTTQLLVGESVGERDGRTKKWTTTFFHPGNDAILEEWFDSAQNEEFIVLEQECDGKVWLFGTNCTGAELFAAFNSGQRDGSGRKGYTVTIEYFGKRIFYTAAIPMKP